MDITPVIATGKQLVESYGAGRFRISGVLYEQAVLLTADAVLPLSAQTIADLTVDTFAPLQDIDTRPTLILLGTGAKQIFPPADLKRALRKQGFIVEAMASDAACRTYNVLLAEERPVAALLLPL